MVPDKGLDRTFVFRFDSGKAVAHGSVASRPGAGPRHIAFHPTRPFAWLVNELDSTVSTLEWTDGLLKPVQVLSTLPDVFTGANTAAAIVVSKDGRFAYCSNRGHDSVAVFSVDSVRGRLTPVGWTPSEGNTPRFITLDPFESMLYVPMKRVIPSFVFSGTGGRVNYGDCDAPVWPTCDAYIWPTRCP